MKAPHRYAKRALMPLCLALGVSTSACFERGPDASTRKASAQDLSQGIASWAEAAVGRSSVKWAGQRVRAPSATARPTSLVELDSEQWPLRVHVTELVTPARLALARSVLSSAEQSYALLAQSGLFPPRTASGPGHSLRRDLYVHDRNFSGAELDPSEVVSDLDAVLAFALVDARVPARARDACVAQALLEAELLELDPAESQSVRQASAQYFSELVSGESCAAAEAPASLTHDAQNVLHERDKLSSWLNALAARQDRNRGVFLQNMWHFARQRTWEGSGLRGSPDLLEAVSKALELSHEKLEEVAGELANMSALAQFVGRPGDDPRRVRLRELPAHLPPSAALAPLDSSYQLIDLEGARAHTRLMIWARGEYGVRWVLSATRLSAGGKALATVNAPVHKYPETELPLELDAETYFVLVSLTNLGTGIPDPDLAEAPERTRAARLIIARP